MSLTGAHSHGVHKKKHKKHKKKHKKKHHQEEEAGQTQAPAKPQLKLKIKLGGQVLGTKRYGQIFNSGEIQQQVGWLSGK